MASDPKRLEQVYRHIRLIKTGDYPVILGNSAGPNGGYRIVERLFAELAEPAKLAVLQEAVDWKGVTNRDRAHILLAEIDPGRITDAQRRRLIQEAASPHSYEETLQEAPAWSGEGTGEVPRLPQTSRRRGREAAMTFPVGFPQNFRTRAGGRREQWK